MTDTTGFTGFEHAMPNNAYELAEFLRNTDDHAATNAMYDRMESTIGREATSTMWDSAGSEIEHDSAIDEAVAALGDAVGRAIRALFEAQSALHRLTEGDAWHVEYAEGGRGEDIGAFLMDSRRAAMAAGALHRETAGA